MIQVASPLWRSPFLTLSFSMLLACGQIAEDPEPTVSGKSAEKPTAAAPTPCNADPACEQGWEEMQGACNDETICKEVTMCGQTIQCALKPGASAKVTSCGPWGKIVASSNDALSCGALDDKCGGKIYCQIDAICDAIPKGCDGLSDTTENVRTCSPGAVLCRRVEDCSGNTFCETKEKDTNTVCNAIPACQGAEVVVAKSGDCSIAGTCVMRTECGTSIWCSAPTR